MSFFGTTLTNGIQDISAILPLLGTEQVARHVGSTLIGGYLYAAVSPMSLFGSLGAVKIAFTIAIACTIIRLSPDRKAWKGAEWLADAGLSTPGDVADLIGSPEAHLRLTSVIDKTYIDNVDELRIRFKSGFIRWNICLILLTLLFAFIGITPYIYILRHSNKTADPIPLWVYPFMRTLGTALVVVCPQLMIQLRLLQIMRNRIIFLSLTKFYDTWKKDYSNKNLNADIHEFTREFFHNEFPDVSKGETAEDWVYRLKDKLLQSKSRPQLIVDPQLPTLNAQFGLWGLRHRQRTSQDHEPLRPVLQSPLQDLQNALDCEEKRHDMNPYTSKFLAILNILTLIGVVSTVIGYVGSFTVVQNATTSSGPLIWLGTEGGLSLSRILIWGSNPTIDDHEGLEFILETLPKNPFLVCMSSENEIDDEKILPFMDSDTFLRDIDPYARPAEPFTRDGVSLLYTLAGSAPFKKSHRILYVTIRLQSRSEEVIIVKFSDLNTRNWRYFNGWTDHTHVRIECPLPEKNTLTQNLSLFERLWDHFREISDRLKRSRSRSQKTTSINSYLPARFKILDKYTLDSNWLLVLKRIKTEEQAALGKLTPFESTYLLEHGKLERDARNLFQRHGLWNEAHMALMRDELLEDRPKADQLLLGDKVELNEIEHLLMYESLALESAFAQLVASRQQDLSSRHEVMIQKILKSMEILKLGNSTEREYLETRLCKEKEFNALNRGNVAKKASLGRLSQERELTSDQIGSVNLPAHYRSAYDASAIEHWITAAIDKNIWHPATEGLPDEDYVDKLEKGFSHALQTGNIEVQAIQESELCQQNNANLTMAKARCLRRQHAMHHRWNMDLDRKGLNEVIDEMVKNGGEDSSCKHIKTVVRIMRSKYTKYLDISDDLILEVGSLDILLSIIKYNEVVTVITISAWLSSAEKEKVADVAALMVNVIYCDGKTMDRLCIWGGLILQAGSLDMLLRFIVRKEIITRITISADLKLAESEVRKIKDVAVRMVNVTHFNDIAMNDHPRTGSNLPRMTYNGIAVEDVFRPGNHYLRFVPREVPRCTIHFQATSGPHDGESRKKILLLSHWGRSQDSESRIRITLIGLKHEDNEKVISFRIYCKDLAGDKFIKQWVEIPLDVSETYKSYELTIELEEHCDYYYLDSAELVDAADAYQWCNENPQLVREDLQARGADGGRKSTRRYNRAQVVPKVAPNSWLAL